MDHPDSTTSGKKLLRRLCLASMTVVSLVLALGFASHAETAKKFKTLHTFLVSRNNDGIYPTGGLVLDPAGNLYGTTVYGGGSKNSGIVFKLTPNRGGSWNEKVIHRFGGSHDGAAPYAGLILDQAGNLYGTTYYGGGTKYAGTVFKLAPNPDGSWTESVLYKFCSITNCGDGAAPSAGLVLDQTGSLYGTTQYGGANRNGVVFKLTPDQAGEWTENVLYSFCSLSNCIDGSESRSGLVFDKAGNLYGTTLYGGPNTTGVVFELMPSENGGWKESVLYDKGVFFASLIFDNAGSLYGTIPGGPYKNGAVFRLSPNPDGRWRGTVLHIFTGGRDGGEPLANLNFDMAGNLYGTTYRGGNFTSCGGIGCGIVFKIAPDSKGEWHETVLHAFVDHPGANPLAGVIFDAAGHLYGTTRGGGVFNTHGSVFEITP
jgi:uncharacterized repeat protein (TIGR03803 family)